MTVAVHDGKDSRANADPAIDDTITVTITVNRPATGMPDIIGTPQAARTLTADIAGIVDEDGLDNAAFTYQWVSNDARLSTPDAVDTDVAGATGTADADIADAADATYTLTDADVGRAVKVRVALSGSRNRALFPSMSH